MDARQAREARGNRAVEDGHTDSTGMHALNEKGRVNMLTSSASQRQQPSQYVYCRTRQDPLKDPTATASQNPATLPCVSESNQQYP